MSFSVGLSRTSLPVDKTFIVISHIFAPKNVHHSHNLTPALSLSLSLKLNLVLLRLLQTLLLNLSRTDGDCHGNTFP